ncbi:MAG: putative LPS assembly protein LptD [Candidatus Cloacimonadota bacterium]|nr:putative LPS assembly protein LptD [Candidatus Cloacimonadota bacterium]
MMRVRFARICIISLIMFFVVVSMQAKEAKADSILVDSTFVKLDSMFYASDSTYYFANKKEIYLMGNAKIDYQNSTIHADTIFLNMKNNQAFSYGKSRIKDKAQTIIGKRLKFDMDSQKGIITNGISEFDKGFYYGDEIRKISKKTFDLDNGYFTTCNAKSPHFYIFSKKMRIYQKDKIVAKPVVFYVNKFPVFAIPFATFSIKRGHHTGFLMPEPGYNSVDGKFIRDITFYTYLGDYADSRISLDFMQRTGWETRLKTRYIKRYFYNGRFFGRLRKQIQDMDKYTYEWYFNYNHNHDFINNKKLNVNLTFISSKQIWEASQDIDERLSERVTSSVSYKFPLGKRSVFITSNYTDDLKNKTRSIILPKVSYSLPSKPFYEIFLEDSEIDKTERWWKNFSYSYKVNGVHKGSINEENPTLKAILYESKKDSLGEYLNLHNAGIKHSGSINYSQKFFGWLSMSQYIYGNETWFDRDIAGNHLARSFDYNTKTSAKFTAYGQRNFGSFYLSAIRHIVSPSVSFSYIPDFSDKKDKYFSFSTISTNSGDKSRRVSFSLSNKWHLKIRKKNNKIKKLNDFLSLRSGFSYDLEKDEKQFSDISNSVNVTSAKYSNDFFTANYRISGRFIQDFYEFNVKNWSYSQSLDFGGSQNYYDYFPIEKNDILDSNLFTQIEDEQKDILTIEDWEKKKQKSNWKLSFGHSFTKNEISQSVSNTVTSSLSLNLTQNWYLSYRNYYDIEDGEIRSQTVRIIRDLHCWKISFDYTKSNDYWSYRLKLFNIKLPDSLKFKTKDHKK